MTYVVTGSCNGCRFTDCVAVCPVDSFYGDDTMLYIDPNSCICCGACVVECPVEAIFAVDEVPEDQQLWIKINADKCESNEVVHVCEKQNPLCG